MLRNYLKIILRNLGKNKAFSFINISGLAIGMAACLLILQYVSFKLSYDQFNKNIKDIYRVVNDRYQNGKLIQHGTITYSAIGKAMQDDYPEVEAHTRVEPNGPIILTKDDKKLEEKDALVVDANFFQFFDYPLLAGDKMTALKDANQIALSEKLARKLFDITGNNLEKVIGNTVVLFKDSLPYKVTAIFADVPENSHLQFNALVSWQTMISTWGWKESDYDFKDSDFWHYIKLRKGTDYKAFQSKFTAFSQKHFQGNKISGSDEKFYLQPLTKAHLYSDFEYEIGKTGSATVVWGLLVIALFIIVIAWVNYINLSTARSVERAKEVGIRKVAGASRPQLIRQFLAESLFINALALILAFALVYLLQGAFNRMVQYELSLAYLFQKGLSGYAITFGFIALIVGGVLISGFYPAFVLSSFKPILVLKGKFSSSKKGIALRKLLVIGQFSITVALIIGAFVVSRQMRFVSQQNLGMNISQILIVKGPQLTNWDSTFISRENTFMSELSQIPHVLGAANSGRLPGEELGRNFNVKRIEHPEDKFTFRRNPVSEHFIDLYNMKMITGRNFISTDYNANGDLIHNVIINEFGVKLLGFKSNQDAVGKQILTGNRKWDVVGVVNDFHQKSLRYPVEATLLAPFLGTNNPISVKVNPQDLATTMKAIKQKYDAFFPGNLFDYYFLNDKFNDQYKNDQLFGKVFSIFSAFAIFVACLGLLGLSYFATVQRTKEIGVRKVLGASVANIVFLLSKDFVRLVLIAFVIAAPIAWFTMHQWLQDFAYRIDIGWWIFLVAGVLALLIALATISFQAISAALANPVKSLRSE